MSAPTPSDLRNAVSLEDLYPKLTPISVGPGWDKARPAVWPSPKANFVPAHWSYEVCKGGLDAAGRLINTELAERRNLILHNPIAGNDYASVRTLVAAYQMILPGEWARSHRHTPNALRLIVDAAPGTYTIVEGQKVAMNPGDVVLTPNWCSHGHGNEGRAAAYWIDFLDVPLVQLLEPMFFEHGEDDDGAAMTSSGATTPLRRDTPLAFPLSETLARLETAEPDPSGIFGTQVQLGAPALDTIALYMMRIEPGRATTPLKTTANHLYAVVEGAGETTVDGQSFSWKRGDVIAAPAWRLHFHKARERSLLLRVSDEPVMQRLGFFRVDAAAA